MNDASLRCAVRKFQAQNDLSDTELDSLVALHHDLIYQLQMFGQEHIRAVKKLRSGLEHLEKEKYLRDTASHKAPFLISA